MAHYTVDDVNNAIKSADARFQINAFNLMLQRRPAIMTKMAYRIRPATQDDYYYPPGFEKNAFIFSAVITKEVCEALNCNPVKENGPCHADERATNVWVGNASALEQQCQPACFHLLDEISMNENNTPQVQSFHMRYNVNIFQCLFVPPSEDWMKHPRYRSEEEYVRRLNDLRVGFDQIYNPNSLLGRDFAYNEYYCSVYGYNWDAANKTCYTPFLRWLAGAIIGENIINSIHVTLQGNATRMPNPNLPPVPDIDPKFLVENWLTDVDPTFKKPPEDFQLEPGVEPPSQNWRPEFDQLVREVEELSRRTAKQARKTKRERYGGNKTSKELPAVARRSGQTQEDYVTDLIISTVQGILESLTQSEFWKLNGVNAAFEIMLLQIKQVFRRLADNMIPRILSTLAERGVLLWSRVFQAALSAQLIRTTIVIAFRQLSSMLIVLARIVAQAASVIGIVLLLITFWDLLLMFWDPLGFSNKFDQEILRDITFQSEQTLRRDMGTNMPALSFNILMAILLTEEELIELSFDSFFTTYEYLDSLEVNSEGSRIDRGEAITTDSITENVSNKATIQSKLWTAAEFVENQKQHTQRMTFFESSKPIIAGCFLAGALFMVLQVYTLAILFFVFAILVIFLRTVNAVWNVGMYWDDARERLFSS